MDFHGQHVNPAQLPDFNMICNSVEILQQGTLCVSPLRTVPAQTRLLCIICLDQVRTPLTHKINQSLRVCIQRKRLPHIHTAQPPSMIHKRI